MALLPKGGLNVAGHKIPWEAVGAVAAVVGVILVLRARQQGTNVASVGTAPAGATLTSPGFGNSFLPDNSGALANITQELTALQQSINQQGINGPTAPAVVPVSAPSITAPRWIPGVGIPGLLEGDPRQQPHLMGGIWPHI